MRKLTKKEELAIEYHLQGDTKQDAVFKAYNCKNIGSASALATKLFRKEDVRDRLVVKQAQMDEKALEKRTRFVDLMDKHITKTEVLKLLIEGMKTSSIRERSNYLDKYFKLKGLFVDRSITGLANIDSMLDDLRDSAVEEKPKAIEPEPPREAMTPAERERLEANLRKEKNDALDHS